MFPEDARSKLVKLIYSMTAKQQAKFRLRFPPGIQDQDVRDAIEYAERIADTSDR